MRRLRAHEIADDTRRQSGKPRDVTSRERQVALRGHFLLLIPRNCESRFSHGEIRRPIKRPIEQEEEEDDKRKKRRKEAASQTRQIEPIEIPSLRDNVTDSVLEISPGCFCKTIRRRELQFSGDLRLTFNETSIIPVTNVVIYANDCTPVTATWIAERNRRLIRLPSRCSFEVEKEWKKRPKWTPPRLAFRYTIVITFLTEAFLARAPNYPGIVIVC